MNGLDFNMFEFLGKADKKIKNLTGIKFAHHNIIDYSKCKNYDNNKYKLATLKTKLNYINNSQFFLEDYDEYINNNKPNNYSIVINIYGEGTVFWTNQFNYYNNYY